MRLVFMRSASHIAAAKFLDAIGRMPGCSGEDADATSAYTQVKMSDMTEYHNVETWIKLPRRHRPDWWDKFEDPVCLLERNLYGHPLAGLLWEKHSNRILMDLGWEAVQGWECLFVHRKEKLFLSVYVDDYKMAGDKKNMAAMWERMKAKIKLGDTVPFHESTYLGCQQENVTVSDADLAEKAKVYRDVWNAKAGGGGKASDEPSPADNGDVDQGVPAYKCFSASGHALPADKYDSQPSATTRKERPRCYQYKMTGHAQQCVERYLELANKGVESLKPVATPNIDDHCLAPEDFTATGELSSVCSRIVLKALYLARMNRLDILWSVNNLARSVSCWNKACDKRLHRLISYIYHNQDIAQVNWVGDPVEDCKLMLFVDASFAGEIHDSKSTTGAII